MHKTFNYTKYYHYNEYISFLYLIFIQSLLTTIFWLFSYYFICQSQTDNRRGVTISKTQLTQPSTYELICLNCGTEYSDQYQLHCTQNDCNALLRTKYPNQTLQLEDDKGLFRFINWLPVENRLPTSAGPITYHAKSLGKKLGLSNLYISFNGYWPERAAYVEACSFKAYEAYPTLQRMRERKYGTLQISSAGNTARAFAIASSETTEKVVIVVPTDALDKVWTINGNHDNILLFAVEGDYYDAITFGKTLVSTYQDLLPEGGARNVARRDGMGLTMLDAAVTMGVLPDYYFQGIGSGTGGIAAYEMARKLVDDGNYGNKMTKFYLSQNLPFAPMYNAWNDGRRDIIENEDMPNAKQSIEQVFAKLLTNRSPPYGVKGGVFDILTQSDGKMLAVNNDEAKEAFELFKQIENVDIDPSAAVALASLIKEINNNNIDKDAKIVLNISGGGYQRIEEDYELHQVKPAMSLKQENYTIIPESVDAILEQFLLDN